MVIKFENVRFIIFDFDGVLFNGLEAIQLGVREAIQKYELNVDFNRAVDDIAALIQDLMPRPIPKIVLSSYKLLAGVEFLKDKSYFKKLQIGLSIYQHYLKQVDEMVLYDGIPEMLEILRGKDIGFAIFTSGTRASVMEKLARCNAAQYFTEDMIIGAGEVTPGRVKPDPEGIEIIFQKAGLSQDLLDKGGLVMVGDMHTDVEAGKSAFGGKGVKTVGIKSGYDSRIADASPDLLLEKATQLLSHFK